MSQRSDDVIVSTNKEGEEKEEKRVGITLFHPPDPNTAPPRAVPPAYKGEYPVKYPVY